MTPEAVEFTIVIVTGLIILGVIIEATRIILDWQDRRYEARRLDRWKHRVRNDQ